MSSAETRTTQLNISISKFIADMHVEIWWSRKICFFYTNVFIICTITQFSVSRCPCPTKQLTTHYPIGFKTTPHFKSYTEFPVETVSNILVIYWRLYKQRGEGGVVKTELKQHFVLIFQFRGLSILLSVGTEGVNHLKIIESVGTPCRFKNHATVTCFTQSLTSQFPCFSVHIAVYQYNSGKTNIECGTIH